MINLALNILAFLFIIGITFYGVALLFVIFANKTTRDFTFGTIALIVFIILFFRG